MRQNFLRPHQVNFYKIFFFFLQRPSGDYEVYMQEWGITLSGEDKHRNPSVITARPWAETRWVINLENQQYK